MLASSGSLLDRQEVVDPVQPRSPELLDAVEEHPGPVDGVDIEIEDPNGDLVEDEDRYVVRADLPGVSPSGLALSPDEKELWLADGHNSLLHVFDLTGDLLVAPTATLTGQH